MNENQMKNTIFIGRTELIKQISNANKRIVILAGPPGIGKTSIAIEFMNQHEGKQFKKVYWFYADDKDKIVGQLYDYGTKMEDHVSSKSREETIKDFIKSIEDSCDVLLVFDNVEAAPNDLKSLKEVDIDRIKCKILITTRNQFEKSTLVTKIIVPSFDINETEELIKTKIPKLNNENINEICEKLKSKDLLTPYYLTMLLSSIENNKDDDPSLILKTVDTFLESKNQFMENLLKSLKSKCKEIVDLLKYAMLIDPDHIPKQIIEKILDGKNIKEAVNILEKQNLCKIKDRNTSQYGLGIHRLLQFDLKNNLDFKNEIPGITNNLIDYLNELFPEVDYVPSPMWKDADMYYRHVKKLENEINNFPDKASKIYYKISLYKKFVLRNFDEALIDGKNSLKAALEYHEIDNELNMAKIYNHIGTIYSLLGKENEAVRNYNKSIESFEKIDNKENLEQFEISTVYSHIGLSYVRLGKHKEAIKFQELSLKMAEHISDEKNFEKNLYLADLYDEIAATFTSEENKTLEYFQKALDIREKVIKDDNPHLAKSYNNVGLAFSRLGNQEKAIEYHLKSLEMRKRLYQGDHPEIAASLLNIGNSYSISGDEEKALECKLMSLYMRERLYKGDHYRLTISMHSTARSYANIGEEQIAIEYLLRSKEMKERILKNQDHPDIAAILRDIGNCYTNLGIENDALKYKIQSLEMNERLDKYYHRMLPFVYIGKSYSNLGNDKKAIEYFEIALETAKNQSMENHPNVAELYAYFAISYSKLGNKEKALEYSRFCLDVDLFKNEHLNSLRHDNIGHVYLELKNEIKALEYYKTALKMRIERYKKDNYYIAMSYMYISLVERDKSLEYQKLASEMYDRIFKDVANHSRKAAALYNTGIIYSNLGDHDNSLKYHRMSLEMKIKIFKGEENLEVANSYYKIGLEYFSLGDQGKAIEYFQRALDLRKKLFQEDSYHVAEIYRSIACSYLKHGNMKIALWNYNSSLNIYKNVLPYYHPKVIELEFDILEIKQMINQNFCIIV